MKVKIFPEKCIACGLCQTYSDRFDYHDDGIVKFAQSHEDIMAIDPLEERTIQAVKACPTKALELYK